MTINLELPLMMELDTLHCTPKGYQCLVSVMFPCGCRHRLFVCPVEPFSIPLRDTHTAL